MDIPFQAESLNLLNFSTIGRKNIVSIEIHDFPFFIEDQVIRKDMLRSYAQFSNNRYYKLFEAIWNNKCVGSISREEIFIPAYWLWNELI